MVRLNPASRFLAKWETRNNYHRSFGFVEARRKRLLIEKRDECPEQMGILNSKLQKVHQNQLSVPEFSVFILFWIQYLLQCSKSRVQFFLAVYLTFRDEVTKIRAEIPQCD